MTIDEAKHKLDYMKKAYQKLIDEKVDSGKLVGDGVRGEWKAETPLDEAYKSMIDALEMAIKALEQEPCEDVVSRKKVIDTIYCECSCENLDIDFAKVLLLQRAIKALSPVTPQPKIGHCKDCKYFEYDSAAKVDGIPLIVAHEICKRWGDGCKSKEDGYCFLFEPKMNEVEE